MTLCGPPSGRAVDVTELRTASAVSSNDGHEPAGRRFASPTGYGRRWTLADPVQGPYAQQQATHRASYGQWPADREVS